MARTSRTTTSPTSRRRSAPDADAPDPAESGSRGARPRRTGVLSHASGAALAFILAAAPFAWACTRPQPLQGLWIGLHAVFGVWILALATERRRPEIAARVLVPALLLLTYVWLRHLLGRPEPLSTFTLQHFARIAARWPESIILRTPQNVTSLVSGLIVAGLVAADLSRRTFWRRAFCFIIALAGLGVVILGLAQNATHAQGIYWQKPHYMMPSRFFGSFYHFTSAGAFINLTWPIAASLAFFAFKRRAAENRSLLPAILWAALAAAVLLGHAGHVSRLPQVIAGVILLGLLAYHRPWSGVRWSSRLALGVAVCGMLVALVAWWTIGRTGRLAEIGARWDMLHLRSSGKPAPTPPPRAAWPRLVRDDLVVPWDQGHLFLADRGGAYQFAAESVARRPFLGYGPGGWIAAISQESDNPTLGTFYLYLQFTHQDYLQTAVEWGLIGAALAGWLVFGALITAAKRLWADAKCPTGSPLTTALIAGALAAIIAVLAQALIDFPLQIPANALYACILLALCWSSAPRRHHREHRSTTTSS